MIGPVLVTMPARRTASLPDVRTVLTSAAQMVLILLTQVDLVAMLLIFTTGPAPTVATTASVTITALPL